MRGEYGGDVAFVNLTPIRDPNLVVPTIAQALGIQEIAGQALLEAVQFALRDRRMLMLLDNFEQVVSAAPTVAALLAAAPLVKALVTSQVVLAVRGEHVYAAPAMARPDRKQIAPGADSAGVLHEYEAVRLFVARAQARQAGFLADRRQCAAMWWRSAIFSTACRLPSNWPRRASPCSRRAPCVDALRANLLKPLKGARRTRPDATALCGRRLTGVTACYRRRSSACSGSLSVFVGGFTLEAMAPCAA